MVHGEAVKQSQANPPSWFNHVMRRYIWAQNRVAKAFQKVWFRVDGSSKPRRKMKSRQKQEQQPTVSKDKIKQLNLEHGNVKPDYRING